MGKGAENRCEETERNEGGAEANSRLMKSLRPLGQRLFLEGPEETDHTEAERGHGESGTNPSQGSAIESECGSEFCQFSAVWRRAFGRHGVFFRASGRVHSSTQHLQDGMDELIGRRNDEDDRDHGQSGGEEERDEGLFIDGHDTHLADNGEAAAEVDERRGIGASEDDIFAGAVFTDPLGVEELIVFGDQSAILEEGAALDLDEHRRDDEQGNNKDQHSHHTIGDHGELQGRKGLALVADGIQDGAGNDGTAGKNDGTIGFLSTGKKTETSGQVGVCGDQMQA